MAGSVDGQAVVGDMGKADLLTGVGKRVLCHPLSTNEVDTTVFPGK